MTGPGRRRTRLRGAWIATLLSVIVLSFVGRPAQAQFVSPGKLAAAHSQLEGMGNCTRCHDLGKRGVSDAKCLACHTPLKARIDRKEGLHATYTGRTCASCHKDHFGTDFALVRFDTARFDHGKNTGFELRLAHLESGCRGCHKQALVADREVRRYASEHRTLDRTYLGLPTGCVDCHRVDDVHADQFGARKCSACHTEETWEEAPLFDHDLSKYRLTGKHRTTECEKCHKPMHVPGVAKPVTRYAGVRAGTCQTCHTDPHQGRMRRTCESCHDTGGWTRLTDRSGFESGFDHGRTKFRLAGAHAQARCAACHDPAAGARTGASGTVRLTFMPAQARAMYPVPRTSNGCLSCHLDVHDSTFVRSPGGATCQNCHSETAWLPSSYDLARHNRETWVLSGAHVVTPCSGCHKAVRAGGPPQFRLGSRECIACHRTQDPHGDQFAQRACTECHVTETFRIATFDHARTRYPLDGQHAKVACAKCHTVTVAPNGTSLTRYRPLETTCRACHGAAIPRRS